MQHADDSLDDSQKLQELIRRGTPKDLAAAQQLMKIMSGAEPDKKPDYEGQSQRELQTIQQRILMLNEMLTNAKPNERFVEGDTYDVSNDARNSIAVDPDSSFFVANSAKVSTGAAKTTEVDSGSSRERS